MRDQATDKIQGNNANRSFLQHVQRRYLEQVKYSNIHERVYIYTESVYICTYRHTYLGYIYKYSVCVYMYI